MPDPIMMKMNNEIDLLQDRTPTTIGRLTIEQAKKEISALLDIYHPEIDASYLACDNDLTVNLKIKLQPHRLGGVDLGVGISFTKSKVNDAVRMRIDERQQKLFKEG
uniref:Uncharacterized protein n=1 Tax=viral metagenome TaxID=1070528 RepID=A0A6M3J4M6_9ZZZZ